MAFLKTFMLSASILLLSGFMAGPVAFWVSPDGSDTSVGSKQDPFNTLHHTIKEIEKCLDQPDKPQNIVVYLKDGVYRFETTLELSSTLFNQGGPSVIFRAAANSRPVISGAVQVQNWSLHDKEQNIYKANIGNHYSRQLYVNGQRATRARTELVDGHIPAGFLPSPIAPNPGGKKAQTVSGSIEYVVADGLNPSQWVDPSRWVNPEDVEAVIETQWRMMSVPVASIKTSKDKMSGQIIMEQPAWTNANLYLSTKPFSAKACTPDKPGIWSFWQVTRFENTYNFIDEAGEWYIDKTNQTLYYKAYGGQDMAAAVVELPVLETLILGHGSPSQPLANITFDGITFAYATWMAPSGPNGYVSDQSGFHVTGTGHPYNVTGHVQKVTRTPGNLSFKYVQNIIFENNSFQHLGGVALDFDIGSHYNQITNNRFIDISSSAVQLGGVARNPLGPDGGPVQQPDHPKQNTISNNVIHYTGQDYVDSAGIFVGFTSFTDISHNTISHVPWSGIAIGWGWGLLDESGFPGISCATSKHWGSYPPTPNSHNKIRFNRISNFLENRWDGGAIYSTGQQGQSMDDPLIIEGNLAYNKRKESGGNVFYTDGGSRFVKLIGNASYDNPIGKMNMGPTPREGNPLPYPDPVPGISAEIINKIHYGGQIGGCRTYGDIHYEDNYWDCGLKCHLIEFEMDFLSVIFDLIDVEAKAPLMLYSKQGFYNICPYGCDGIDYPTNLSYSGNHHIFAESEIPKALMNEAGVKNQE